MHARAAPLPMRAATQHQRRHRDLVGGSTLYRRHRDLVGGSTLYRRHPDLGLLRLGRRHPSPSSAPRPLSTSPNGPPRAQHRVAHACTVLLATNCSSGCSCCSPPGVGAHRPPAVQAAHVHVPHASPAPQHTVTNPHFPTPPAACCTARRVASSWSFCSRCCRTGG